MNVLLNKKQAISIAIIAVVLFLVSVVIHSCTTADDTLLPATEQDAVALVE